MRLTKQTINRTYEIMGLFEALKTNIDYSSVVHTADIPNHQLLSVSVAIINT